jgi:RHS repeat-associated protein
VNQSGNTPNVYLIAGEQYDTAFGLYYHRTRYLNTATGRFWNMDSYEGNDEAGCPTHSRTLQMSGRCGRQVNRRCRI